MRIGYARTSTARQELASQLEALRRAECHKIFHEQISTRVKVRPELEKALALAHQFMEAAPETPVIFTVHELKRLARDAAELMTLSAELQADGNQLELLTGPLTGIYDPNGMGAMFFAVLAVTGQIERNFILEKTLEGQVIAAAKGNHRGRPKVIDDDSLTFALALKDKGVPVPDIAKKLTIKRPDPNRPATRNAAPAHQLAPRLLSWESGPGPTCRGGKEPANRRTVVYDCVVFSPRRGRPGSGPRFRRQHGGQGVSGL